MGDQYRGRSGRFRQSESAPFSRWTDLAEEGPSTITPPSHRMTATASWGVVSGVIRVSWAFVMTRLKSIWTVQPDRRTVSLVR